jgi:predicted NAD/FAD-binding protein
MRIAVIGSGISGLAAAWLLSKRHQVTLYESERRLGGHANTVDVETPDGVVAVDTGFIVYNRANYPNLDALFRQLGVRTRETEMSFALSMGAGAYEYTGSGANGFFGQRRNLFNPGHWRLLGDMTQFFRSAHASIRRLPNAMSLGSFLALEGYSEAFINEHIVPMGAAIWSTRMREMMHFPARAFLEFYANHGLLQFSGRPTWRTVEGGSRAYVERLCADGGFEIQSANAVQRLVRHPDYVHVVDSSGVLRPFDHAVIASHADQALAMLDDPDEREERILGSFSYQANRAVLHRDKGWMPRRKRIWSNWNYLKQQAGVDSGLCVTYWMNGLQNLATRTNLFVTLNPFDQIPDNHIECEFQYHHPVFSHAALEAQRDLWQIQGGRRTWFCGSYFGYGFHEDGARSGFEVAEELGSVRRPWSNRHIAVRRAASMPVPYEAAE